MTGCFCFVLAGTYSAGMPDYVDVVDLLFVAFYVGGDAGGVGATDYGAGLDDSTSLVAGYAEDAGFFTEGSDHISVFVALADDNAVAIYVVGVVEVAGGLFEGRN